MPQQDDDNVGHRRGNGPPDLSQLLGSDPYRDFIRKQDQALFDELRCRNLPAPVNPPYTMPEGGFFSGVGAYQRVQKDYSERHGYGRVTIAQRNHLSLAEVAENHRRSIGWSNKFMANITDGHMWKPGSDKCIEFVADCLIEAGFAPPVVQNTARLATAREYADLTVRIQGLTAPMPRGLGQRGDILAQQHDLPYGHVGIIVAPGLTASASTAGNHFGLFVINNWGFRNPNADPNNGETHGDQSPPPLIRKVIGVSGRR